MPSEDDSADAEAQNDPSFTGDGPIICNHVLAYIAYGLLNSPDDHIKEACCEFFSVPEIVLARDVLWLKCEDQIGTKMKRRQQITSKKGCSATVNDIVDAMVKLTQSESDMPRFVVDFAKLGRIPRSKPSEKCSISICERLARLEARVSSHDGNLEELNLRVAQEASRPASYAAVAARQMAPPDDGPSSSSPNPDVQGTSTQQNAHASANMHPHERPHSSINWGSVQVPAKLPPGPSVKRKPDERAWVTRRGQRIIRGTGKNQSKLKGAPEPSRDVFISRVLPQYTEEDIREHLLEMGIEPRCIEQKSHIESRFKSFRVELALSNMAKVMDPERWDDGICIKRWYPSRDSGDKPRPHDGGQ